MLRSGEPIYTDIEEVAVVMHDPDTLEYFFHAVLDDFREYLDEAEADQAQGLFGRLLRVVSDSTLPPKSAGYALANVLASWVRMYYTEDKERGLHVIDSLTQSAKFTFERAFLASIPYKEYLQSAEWQERRSAALERAGHRCQVCNGADRLQVHHRTYAKRGREDPEDLIVLCDDCHSVFHRNGRLMRS